MVSFGSKLNIWMSLSISLLGIWAMHISSITFDWNYIAFLFFGSNSVYHFHRLVRHGLFQQKSFQERQIFVKQNKSLLIFWTGICAILAGVNWIYSQAEIPKLGEFSLLLFIILFYALPLIKLKDKWLSLRDIPFTKVGLVAYTWAYLVGWMPFDKLNYPIFFSVFILIYAITIPFDIRDIEFDKMKTFANTLGISKTIALSVLLLSIWLGLLVFFFGWNSAIPLTLIYTFTILYFTTKTRANILYSFFLELSPVFYVLCYFLEKGNVLF
jgi:hypothetical protein